MFARITLTIVLMVLFATNSTNLTTFKTYSVGHSSATSKERHSFSKSHTSYYLIKSINKLINHFLGTNNCNPLKTIAGL